MNNESSQWIQQVVNSTPGFEQEIFDKYSQQLYRYAQNRMPPYLNRRVDADDVLQSVFRSFFRRHANHEFEFDKSFDLWQLLAAITYRKICNAKTHHHAMRRNVLQDRDLENQMARESDCEPGPEQINELCDLVQWMLKNLPERYHDVIRLRLEGFLIREISDQTSISQRTIKRILIRARDLLESATKPG